MPPASDSWTKQADKLLLIDIIIVLRYYRNVIGGFASKEAEKIFRGLVSRQLPVDIQKIARRKLLYLHEAEDLRDLLAPPGNKLEKLRGDREGQYSIRINDQWRICFKWKVDRAYDVEIVDYHS